MLGQDEVRTIYTLLGKIDQREAEILKLRFGLEDGQPLTLQEIGEKVGLTRARVRQIESAMPCAVARLSDREPIAYPANRWVPRISLPKPLEAVKRGNS